MENSWSTKKKVTIFILARRKVMAFKIGQAHGLPKQAASAVVSATITMKAILK